MATNKKYQIQYGCHLINDDDVRAVKRVLEHQNLTQGMEVDLFEEEISSYVGSKYSVACNSATSALHLACLSLNIGKNSNVWVTSITFVASSNCALYCGSNVDFCDIDSLTFNIDLRKLEEKLKKAKKEKNLPDLIIVTHLAGHPVDLVMLEKLKNKYKFKVIEDASHAIGSTYHGSHIGSCKYSDITVFSFHPVKIITTGEGGLATTNDEHLYSKMRLLRSHGITKDLDYKKRGPWEYDQINLGFNYRMTDIQASLGRSQLKKINKFILSRNKIAEYYNEQLSDLPLSIQVKIERSYSSFHLYLIKLDLERTRYSHKRCHEKMRENGILVNLHYRPVYLMPYYRKINQNFKEGYCENSELYAGTAMSLPIHANLKKKREINYVIQNLKKLFY